jgi:hypothetical protein
MQAVRDSMRVAIRVRTKRMTGRFDIGRIDVVKPA